MENLITRPELTVLALVLIIESLKALLLGTATAYQRGKSSKFVNTEDAKWLGGDVVFHDEPISGRLFRAQRNTLENLVPFTILSIIYVFVDANSTIGLLYFVSFLISRLAHTYAYLNYKPMLRRNAYSVAWLVQIIMSLHSSVIIIGGYTGDV